MSARPPVDAALVDMMEAVFSDYREKHPPAGTVERDPALWQRLDELGLVRLTGTEQHRGSGASWYEAAELMATAVRHGVRIPLAEHDLLACWLLEASGMPAGDAVRTMCVLDKQGTATDVPWAASADRIVVVWRAEGGHRVADVAAEQLTITQGGNLIGEPRDTVAAEPATLHGVPVTAALLNQLQLKAALVRSIQVSAALDRILQLCVDHAAARVQFGRPLSKFQAVQNLISDIAAEAALARATTEAALHAAVIGEWSTPDLAFLVAVARSCAGHATSVVVRNAHQVHGAIGTTREHALHEFTRAALAWRSEFGSVRYWDERVTDAALHASAGALWELITG
ncbi:acyl-CoA dehydrogenase family protein [Mycobacterium sp. 852002-10029_SCH5224772]|uniref:acyl-CoA dehydrogenase family protein n=1 Tax=Mycobacterium sp. 852002-10029_SCH5224772 TaxID=1834083 RepID=UPI0008017398|nr:acyl-CoA dehydrogenase family protein [Mycobacterium sp. 852002-10029_SCH5224772]OBF06354.1 acyl-CoA dehydrogenase [Mycobacterium sp. 852002-10029_SCH5224772]